MAGATALSVGANLGFLGRKAGADQPLCEVRVGAGGPDGEHPAGALAREMAEEFGPSIALIASGYNAGPGRPRRWIGEFGDPRRADVDVVDWVETIPFAETRTYVMRVAEGVVIYRAKLKGVAGPVRVTAELTGRTICASMRSRMAPPCPSP